MARFNWDLARRRDPREDPNITLQADHDRMVVFSRLCDYPMSITPEELRKDPAGAKAQADEIQLVLDSDLELCRWAADALPAPERRKFLRRAEREHRQCSAWLTVATGEAFSTRPPKRHRIDRQP